MSADRPAEPAPADRFPVGTAVATLCGLFLFLGLVLVAYYSPNYLGGGKAEPKPDPAVKLREVQARNQAALDGTDPGAKSSAGAAAAAVLAHAEKTKAKDSPHGRLPFPVPPAAPAPAEKK
jgi:hypothetical protein